ncbi:hypothetical protein CSPAE12_08343 [Colletotrichum incanum]|nr:hypothetical protein CSPAE12_08343 [Colletotrichum incanum]
MCLRVERLLFQRPRLSTRQKRSSQSGSQYTPRERKVYRGGVSPTLHWGICSLTTAKVNTILEMLEPKHGMATLRSVHRPIEKPVRPFLLSTK